MNPNSAFDTDRLIRRIIFCILAIGLFMLFTVFNFNGLTSKTGIDQAQIAREVARGNGFSTKFIRPVTLQQMKDNDKEIDLLNVPETYHSPLNILVYAGVLKMVGGDNYENYRMGANDTIYKLDRIIAMTCSLFFLVAIGLNYLLISRIFDNKIASIVALIMIFSSYMWEIAQAGLPQMLMLTLFSAACYMAWLAVESQESYRKPLIPALLSGFFFGLLILAHWMALWIFMGYFIFACFYFRPRGAIAIGLALIIASFVAGPLIYNFIQIGEPAGTAFHAIHAGGSDSAMRQLDQFFNVKGILIRTAQTTLIQISNVHNYLGGLILAPAFFICLAYPFQRSSIAIFRWNILVMWAFASIGMAIYGLSESKLDPNQLHLLFAPLMCAFALALISIIWSRCSLSESIGFIRNLPIIVIVTITIAPLLLEFRQLVSRRTAGGNIDGVNHYALNATLNQYTNQNDIIISDQPWAVAWYADRYAIWIPLNTKSFEAIENMASKSNPIAGLHITSTSYKDLDILQSLRVSQEFTGLAYIQWFAYLTRNPAVADMSNNPNISPLTRKYKYIKNLTPLPEPSNYYSRTMIRLKN